MAKYPTKEDILFNIEEGIIPKKVGEELLKRIGEGMTRHGKWETNKVAFMKTCSLCGKSVDQSHDYNFCPECGAKMDLEGE